jgi:hypothetical protein
MKHKLLFELNDSDSAGHYGYLSTLPKASFYGDKVWWRRIRQDVNDYCHRCVVCRRAKERPQMAAITCYLLFRLDLGKQLD